MTLDGDVLSIAGIEAYGYHGVAPEEKVLGQTFVLDLDLGLDLGVPGRSDALADTLNYVTVVERVRELVAGPSLNLIEALAERVADGLLQSPMVRSVRVRVTKPHIPAPIHSRSVSVAITRSRGGN